MPSHRSKLDGWMYLTDWHLRRIMPDGKALDYWPTKDKWRHQGQTQTGDVDAYIEGFEGDRQAHEPSDEEIAAADAAWWSWSEIDDGVSVYIVHEGVTKTDAAPRVLRALESAQQFYRRVAA